MVKAATSLIDSGRGIWAVWAGFALFALGSLALPQQGAIDPDAFMRLVQVRDLLGGQAWFDVTQYRMDPPRGAAMHWSRLVDLPLAGMILLLGTVLPAARAEYWASAILPVLYMGAGLFLLRAIMRTLGLSERQALLGLLLLLLFPLVPPSFAPMRVDHHVPQMLVALVCALMLLKTPAPGAAIVGGMAAAVWVVISLEGLPVVAAIAGLYGLRYVLTRDRSLAWYLAGLAGAAALLSLATRPPSEFAMWCDILLPAHWAAFAAGAAIAALIPALPGQGQAKGRIAALCLLPIVCGAVAFSMLGPCAADPFASLDPLTKRFFHEYVREGLPFWEQPLGTAVMVLWLPVVIAAGLHAAHLRGMLDNDRATHWYLYAALTGIVTLYGAWLLRETLLAQLLAAPFAALALMHWMPKARALKSTLPRVFATVAVVLFVTPSGPTFLGKQLEPMTLDAPPPMVMIDLAGLAPCDIPALNLLPPGQVFNTLNAAPAILAQTHHTAEMGPYHRNVAGMREVILGFRSDSEEARAIIAASGADYVAVCLEEDSLRIFGEDRPDSLAQLILRDEAPGWLVADPRFSGTRLRVYAVR